VPGGTQFEDVEDAKDAMKGVNQMEYKGRILTVEYVAREANGRRVSALSPSPPALAVRSSRRWADGALLRWRPALSSESGEWRGRRGQVQLER